MDEDTLTNVPQAIAAERSTGITVQFKFGAATNIGLCRTTNEDHFAVVCRTRSRKILLTNVDTKGLSFPEDDAHVLIVADGIGGHSNGGIASEHILRIGWDLASVEPTWFMKFNEDAWLELRGRVEDFAHRMKQELQSEAEADPKLAGMGTTWTCVYLMGANGFVAQVGDSRAYLFRDTKLKQLTRDQTYARELEERGVPEKVAAKFQHVLTNAFVADDKEMEIDIDKLAVQDRDRLLLCSDGLSNMLTDAEISATLASQMSPQATCDLLVEQALERGGKDNVTVVIADVHSEASQ